LEETSDEAERPLTSTEHPLTPSQWATIEDIDESDAPIVPDHLGDVFEEVEPERWGKQVRKASAYVRRLREGEGVTDARPSASLLPEGLKKGIEVGDLAEEGSDDWEMVEVVEEHVMITAIEGTEGLNPNFDEAWKHPDWPQWEAAIHAEIKSLNDNWNLDSGWAATQC